MACTDSILHPASAPVNRLCRLVLVLVGLAAGAWSFADAAEPAKALETKTLHNVFSVEGKLYSGNSPENEEGFRELQKLGVKTIISVDGSEPNVELAHKYGMRYVHLPIGYDGVPEARRAELVKAAQLAAASGPVYMHCHHGKHRGPAAAAIVCRALDGWSAEKADEFLKQAGTSPDYAGLFRDVKTSQSPTAEQLAKLPATFPEKVKPAPLVDAMVTIDERFDALKGAQKAGWREVPGHPDLKPAQMAALLWESLRELGRDPETKKRGDDYMAKMAEGEKAADALRKLLGEPASDAAARDGAMQAVTKNCTACHKAHRN
jgi:protein tyrosine phosphatase (PTP) superfamily phosphohydrolase (DUF442 family)